MRKIKVCGLTDRANLCAMAECHPDFVGFIFAPSPRRADERLLDVRLPGDVRRVGVFVDPSLDDIKTFCGRLDAIQLHGTESPEFCASVRQLGFLLLKAFAIESELPLPDMERYRDVIDYALLDCAGPLRGGNGRRFAWNLLNAYDSDIPFLLSGGIALNDALPLRRLKCDQLIGFDINSRFESAPGIKNSAEVGQFIYRIRQTNPADVDSKGYYGDFGGAFIPEMLYPNVTELADRYREIIRESSFQKEFRELLRTYVGRPTPLYYARRLSEKYGASIYLKREDLCHTGAHKINNTIGQALLARRLEKTRIIAETGAGQHGVATATVCALLGLHCTVFMGARDIERQRPNVDRMRFLGADVQSVTSGSQTLKDATNEALREWIRRPLHTYYLIGSVVGPHPYPDMVTQFQSVISEEIREQLLRETGRANPDSLIACVGGGSNAAGAFYHFLDDEVELIGAEAAGEGLTSGRSAATISLGRPGILHGSRTLVIQDEDGQILEAHSISAGLDYPGVGPLHACLHQAGRIRFVAVTDSEALAAGRQLARLEGIIPALESAHALAVLDSRESLRGRTVVINLSGRGDKDMAKYTEES